jgi:methyl-coenzyme M reductase gamma subunit
MARPQRFKPQYYPGSTSVAINRRKFMSDNLDKLRHLEDEDLTAILGHRAPGSDYPSAHPPLAEMDEPIDPVREVVEPTPGARGGDRIRYVQFVDSMYNAPATPYWRSYHAAINFRGVDIGAESGRQIIEMRERDLEEYAKRVSETEMTDFGLSGMRGVTSLGHSLRLQMDGTIFDMLDRSRLEGDVIVMDKDQQGVPIDRKVNFGNPMNEVEAVKRTTIYRVDNVPFRSDNEVIEHVQRIWDLRTKWGFQPKV